MTLRARLTLFFTGIVVVPLLAATALLQVLAGEEIQRRTDTRLEVGARAAERVWHERVEAARREVRAAAMEVLGTPPGADLDALVDRLRTERDVDFLVVTGPGGGLRASSVDPPDFLPGVPTPEPGRMASQQGVATVLRARAPLGAEASAVAAGWYVDQRFVEELATLAGTGVMLVVDGRAVASTVIPSPEVPPSDEGMVDLESDARALVSRVAGHRGELVLIAEREGRPLPAPLWAVVVLGLLVATLIAYLLAGVIVRPVEHLAEGARAVAEGRFDTRIEVQERGDVGHVAESFNVMTDYVRRYVEELEGSRDELRRSLERLGGTLQVTHDLGGMLRVVLETAVATLGASSGAAFLLDAAGRQMRLEVATGFQPSRLTLQIGRGVAGRAAEGEPVLMTSPDDDVAPAVPLEPSCSTAVAVPLVRGDRGIGVLALYGRSLPQPFVQEDVATLASFGGQASVAIENVLLHEEAKRLSITDGLTGVWNRRYLQMMLVKEIERSQRFDRPLSVLLVDLDRFKQVNDRHGHLVGDAVLVEVAQRMTETVRTQIDSVARFGGEEFILVLPETPPRGALVVAEKIRESISGEDILVNGTPPLRVTVSIGIASMPADGLTTDDLLRAADDAMYRAKQKGRDRIEPSPASASSLGRHTL